MIQFEAVEKRILFHSFFIQNGVLVLLGLDGVDDTLRVTVDGSNFKAEAVTDGFSQEFPIAQVTKGIELDGLSGNDDLSIGTGILLPTTLAGEAGNDTINGGQGNDLIYGDEDNDLLLGNGGKDKIHGGTGNDTLSGGTKNDTLVGEAGADFLVGSAGLLDVVDYSEKTADVQISLDGIANDGVTSEGDNIAETCEGFVGGSGNDTIRGSGKPNRISGGAGNDTLIGGSGNDTIDGGAGRDDLQGQAGKDSLLAKDGEEDTLSGGSSADSGDFDDIDKVDTIP